MFECELNKQANLIRIKIMLNVQCYVCSRVVHLACCQCMLLRGGQFAQEQEVVKLLQDITDLPMLQYPLQCVPLMPSKWLFVQANLSLPQDQPTSG